MILSAVVVVDANNGIGKENKLLVHFPADLKRFKKITSGHTVIMGRKTYESMGKALPNRRNIVISRQPGYALTDSETTHSLEAGIGLAEGEEEVFIIGGAEIFRQALPVLNKVYLTHIDKTFDADTFFPELDKNQWHEEDREDHQPDEKTPFSYSFLTYKKG
ncbi:dihydrofolate reductase [Desertivirga arenae]|uniref:dihydrofolate reductase n=1 Tax=Desertivirga arenae TaxID=2810309 RepID=UPI001A957894|nr:dihydrofolate reductase [Pedobacter sp. SYSU D00823]